MSILLEALKKSEEQRQLGTAPNIHSPGGEPVRGPDGGVQWVPLGMMTLAAIAMTWIGWQQFREPPDSGVASTAEVVVNETAGEEPQPEGQGPSPAAADNGAAATEVPGEPVMARRPQMVANAGRRTPVESFKPDTRAPKNAQARPSAEAVPVPADSPAAQGMAQVELPPRAAAEEGGQQQSRGVQGQPAAAEARPHVPDPISYWELPQNVRDDLPDLHISVLVYAERREDRFILINGQRRVENTLVDHDLLLEEIRRDGAVFTYRTYRFLVEG